MNHKRLQHAVEFRSLQATAALIRLMPLTAARFFARRLADLAWYVVPVRKQVVLQNLRASFQNEYSETGLRRIAHRTYRQFAQTMIELILFPRLGPSDIARLVQIEGIDVLDRARAAGKGGVLVGAHFGNWELMGAAIALHYPVSFIIGRQQNEQVDDLLNSYRLGKGLKLIPLKSALRGALKTLKNNEFVAILSDQDAHEAGAFVEFFGRPASTPQGPALFALRAGCPLIVGTMVRHAQGTGFTATFEEVPLPPRTGDDEKDIVAYTAAYTRIIERWCRAYPDHWFWMHKRWKTRKPA